jgi:hypothetical protein
VTLLCADNAQSKEGCIQALCDTKASEFIPADWLEVAKLDGDFKMGFFHPVTDATIFVSSDPSLALKRVSSALKG